MTASEDGSEELKTKLNKNSGGNLSAALSMSRYESALPESDIPLKLNSLSLTLQLLTEGEVQGTQVAFEIHWEEVQEIDQSLVLDLQYKNHIKTSHMTREDNNDSNGCCYWPLPHESTAQ